MSWTRDEIYALHRDLSEKSLTVLKQKSEDYSHADDPFRNFRLFGPIGILIRMSDKIARLRTFEERGQFSVNESVEDAILDLQNYATLYLAYHLSQDS